MHVDLTPGQRICTYIFYVLNFQGFYMTVKNMKITSFQKSICYTVTFSQYIERNSHLLQA